ncbi:MAG: helix-turn-helix domain-containing protein [Paracoccaceae bacterium]
MARNSRNNGKRSEDGQYTNLTYAMLKSPAWRSLSGAAVKVLLELHTRFNGGNNGNVRLSLAEAAKSLGLGKATVKRALTDLQDRGFIILTVPGNWYHRRAQEWQLTACSSSTKSVVVLL